jgi:hypothetical protein
MGFMGGYIEYHMYIYKLRATAGDDAGCRGRVVDALYHPINVCEANIGGARAHVLFKVWRHEGEPQPLRCTKTINIMSVN